MTGFERYPTPKYQVIKTTTVTLYTPTKGDVNKLVTLSNVSPISVVIDSTLSLPVGHRIDFVNLGTGSVTFSPSGPAVDGTPGLKLRTRYSAASLICLADSKYLLIGDLSA